MPAVAAVAAEAIPAAVEGISAAARAVPAVARSIGAKVFKREPNLAAVKKTPVAAISEGGTGTGFIPDPAKPGGFGNVVAKVKENVVPSVLPVADGVGALQTVSGLIPPGTAAAPAASAVEKAAPVTGLAPVTQFQTGRPLAAPLTQTAYVPATVLTAPTIGVVSPGTAVKSTEVPGVVSVPPASQTVPPQIGTPSPLAQPNI